MQSNLLRHFAIEDVYIVRDVVTFDGVYQSCNNANHTSQAYFLFPHECTHGFYMYKS